MLALLLLSSAFASAAAPVFTPVTTERAGAVIDWSALTLSLQEGASPVAGSRGELQVVEQQARSALGPRVLAAAGDLRVDASTRARDLIESGSPLGETLGQGLSSWEVREARYFLSGRVELAAELDLRTWLEPVVRARASVEAPREAPSSRFTGVVVDARGLGAEGALAPRLLGPDGQVLYGAEQVLEAAARKRSPAQYVSDPGDPRAFQRAGASPLLLRAAAVQDGVDLVLGAEDTARLRATASDPKLLPEARVVLVLDP